MFLCGQICLSESERCSVLLRSDGPAQGSIFCVLQRGSHVSAAKKIQVFSFFFSLSGFPSTLSRKKGAS